MLIVGVEQVRLTFAQIVISFHDIHVLFAQVILKPVHQTVVFRKYLANHLFTRYVLFGKHPVSVSFVDVSHVETVIDVLVEIAFITIIMIKYSC